MTVRDARRPHSPHPPARNGYDIAMAELPEHVLENRKAWTEFSVGFEEPGRSAWASDHINWGIWDVRESDIHALGDLKRWRGKDVIELGCGTGYISAWLARIGMHPVGIDITPAQIANARKFQKEFNLEFPILQCSAEDVPLKSESFDLAISEYGASIWCDPYKWIPEAARLLRPGGTLVFLRNGTLSVLCTAPSGPVTEGLQRDYFEMHRITWEEDPGVEFHLPPGKMIQVLRDNGFEVEALIEIEPPADAKEVRYEYMNLNWAKHWPSEEIWRAVKRG